MSSKLELTEKHSFKNEMLFRCKVAYFIFKKSIANVLHNVHQYKQESQLIHAPVVAVSESDLWNASDNKYNWFLTAGKVENLRVASRKIHGIEVPANEVFSFWKHIGKPSAAKGFVVGREIREGCVVPTIAGGLCQLSNALYDAALKAGFEIIERHKHTRVIQGSLAEKDRDATVKWNYVDLRFKGPNAFRIEVEFTSEKFIVKFKSVRENTVVKSQEKQFESSKINDCYSCGNTACFKHPGVIPERKVNVVTAYILDEKIPEIEEYLVEQIKEEDIVLAPFSDKNIFKIPRYSRTLNAKVLTYPLLVFRRAFSVRRAAKAGRNIPSLMLSYDERIVKSLLHKIPVEVTHIVIAQNLLPFAFKYGLLWGRTFDVLTHRLPIKQLQNKLDELKLRYPESSTAADFRVKEEIVLAEQEAFNKARKIITSHLAVVDIFKNKCVLLNWKFPIDSRPSKITGKKILFPASALARKGAFEMKHVVTKLKLPIDVLGKAKEYKNFWESIEVHQVSNLHLSDYTLVVLPAYIEHQPRILLRALSLGITVITTKASGLPKHESLIFVEEGDVEDLERKIKLMLEING